MFLLTYLLTYLFAVSTDSSTLRTKHTLKSASSSSLPSSSSSSSIWDVYGPRSCHCTVRLRQIASVWLEQRHWTRAVRTARPTTQLRSVLTICHVNAPPWRLCSYHLFVRLSVCLSSCYRRCSVLGPREGTPSFSHPQFCHRYRFRNASCPWVVAHCCIFWRSTVDAFQGSGQASRNFLSGPALVT